MLVEVIDNNTADTWWYDFAQEEKGNRQKNGLRVKLIRLTLLVSRLMQSAIEEQGLKKHSAMKDRPGKEKVCKSTGGCTNELY